MRIKNQHIIKRSPIRTGLYVLSDNVAHPIREYDVGLCKWFIVKSPPNPNFFDEAQKILVCDNGQMVLIGVKELSQSGMYEYKLVKNFGIKSGEVRNLKSMTVSRQRFSVVYLGKEIYVFGGLNGTLLKTVEK